MPQVPTARGIKIRSAADAHILFFAVHLGRLPIIQRRLDTTERCEVASGAVFIWEERSAASPQTSSGSRAETDTTSPPAVVSGIERWTDGLKWGPSRVRDDFLFYQEKDSNDRDTTITPPHNSQPLYRNHSSRPSDRLVKQTYSVYYHPQILEGRVPVKPARKLHLTAYQSPGTVERLVDVTFVPELQGITPPDGLFKKARVGRKRDNLPSDSQDPSDSHNTSMTNPNVAGNTRGVRTVPSPNYGHVGASGSGYGNRLGDVASGGSGALGGVFTHEIQTGTEMPPHPHSHGHHQNPSSSPGRYGLGGHIRQGLVEMGAPHMNRPIPPPHASQQGQSSTGYPTTHHPRYGSNSVPPPPPPPAPVFSHSHSHSGMVTYGDSYGGHVRYSTGYGLNGAGGGGYDYDRNSPYSATGRIATPQLPPSVTVASDPAYNPSRPGTSQSVPPHPTSASIPPPPPNTLSQIHPHHQHHRSHSHSYSNGQGHPGSQTGTPVMHYARPESHSFSTPIQQPTLPPTPGSEHHRTYSTSEIGFSGGGNGIRSPNGSGAIRTRREANGANRSDERATLSTSPPLEGANRCNFFSPYSRPGNAPGPKQHSVFASPLSNIRRPGTAGTSFEDGYGGGQFTAEHPYQTPGMPIAHSRSHSLPHPHPYPAPAVPASPLAANSLYQPPPPPPSQHSNAGANDVAGIPPQYGGNSNSNGYAPPFRQINYSTTILNAAWSHATVPPLYPAGSSSSSAALQSPHLTHAYATGHGVISTDLDAAPANPSHSTSSYPPHMAPHLNPDLSPPMSHFRAPSISYGSGGSGGSGMGESPELARQHYSAENGGYPAEIMSTMAANGGVIGEAGPVGVGRSSRKQSLPSALDTSITSSSSTPTSASLKLVPLTPLAHPTCDPEDERVLDLLSRSGGGRGSGDAGSVTSAGGIGPGTVEDEEGKLDE